MLTDYTTLRQENIILHKILNMEGAEVLVLTLWQDNQEVKKR
jgi:hypothetical protein